MPGVLTFPKQRLIGMDGFRDYQKVSFQSLFLDYYFLQVPPPTQFATVLVTI